MEKRPKDKMNIWNSTIDGIEVNNDETSESIVKIVHGKIHVSTEPIGLEKQLRGMD